MNNAVDKYYRVELQFRGHVRNIYFDVLNEKYLF